MYRYFPHHHHQQFSGVERAQIYNNLARSAATLFNMYLQTKGVDTEDHSFRKEQVRLKQYHKKVRKLAAEEELKNSRPTLELDVAAMSRFISAALPNLTLQQREELKEAGRKEKVDKQQQQQQQQRDQEKDEAAEVEKERKKSIRDGGIGISSVGGGITKKKRRDSHKDDALAFLHETLAEVKKP